MEYLDFSDYVKVITKKQNWERVFRTIFLDAKAIEARISELALIRNKAMHATQITDSEFRKLKSAYDEISEVIDREIGA